MSTGTIATVVIAAVIAFFFVVGIRKIVRKFTGKEDCCGSGSSCGGSCCSCHAGQPSSKENEK